MRLGWPVSGNRCGCRNAVRTDASCLIMQGGSVRFAVRVTRAIALLSIVAGLSACGTGNQQPVASAATNSLTFSVNSPDDPTPAPQTFTASVSPGTVSVAILHGGSAVANATYTLSGNTAQVVVDPASPSTLGSGVFSGTVTVTGYSCGNPTCSQLVSGNSQVIAVTYNIPSIVRYVAPYIGVASSASPTTASGSVIIRGQGFEAFPVQGVTFDGTAATSFSVVSDTEIQASYSLPAASTAPVSYPVQIVLPPSSLQPASKASLVIVPVTNYSATAISYPSGVTGVDQLLYDAQRQALLLVANMSSGPSPELWRYPLSSGPWSLSPVQTALAPLVDIALSTDGNELLALSQQELTQLDPSTLKLSTASPNPTPAPGLATGVNFKNLAVANDGNAVVTTGNGSTGSTGVWLYAARSPAFTQPSTAPSLDNATPGASADGSIVALEQGDPSLASAPPDAYEYIASSGSFAATSAAINQNGIAPALALNQSAGHIILNGTNVYDGSFNYLGSLLSTTQAVVLSPDSNCAYTFDSSGYVLTYDLANGPSGGAFAPLGSGLSVSPGAGPVKMAITPDGNTLFIAGSGQILVEPTPTQCR